MKYEISSNGNSLQVEIRTDGSNLVISNGNNETTFDAEMVQPGVYSVLLNNRSYVVGVGKENENRININGAPFTVELLDAVHLHLRDLGWESVSESQIGQVSTLIPGLITKIFHKTGDQVEQSEPLFLIEAMKMENEIKAPISGTINRVDVKEGQTVDKGTLIIEIG